MSLRSVRIRAMNADDLAAVVAIAAKLKDAPHWASSAYESALSQESSPLRITLAAENPEDRTVAGFAMARIVGGQAELETIAVAPEAQRQGIAGKLFGALLSELSQAGVTEVMLEVRESNEPALALYRTLGFELSGRRSRYYAEPVEDAILMNLQVGRRDPAIRANKIL